MTMCATARRPAAASGWASAWLIAALAWASPAWGEGKTEVKAPPAYEAKGAVYRFDAEMIQGRTLQPRLPFKKFSYQSELMISPPPSAVPKDRGSKQRKKAGHSGKTLGRSGK